MSKCLILSAYIEDADKLSVKAEDYKDMICADGGQTYARRLGLSPTRYIGDYDSSKAPEGVDDLLTVLPHIKDMADTEAALDMAVEMGYKEVLVLGGMGGRFDHSMGNIGMLLKYRDTLDSLVFEDGNNRLRLLTPGSYTFSKDRFFFFSLAAYGGPVTGLSVSGTFYPLENATLVPETTLGISNEILGETATVSFENGLLFVIQSNDKKTSG